MGRRYLSSEQLLGRRRLLLGFFSSVTLSCVAAERSTTEEIAFEDAESQARTFMEWERDSA